MEKVKVLILGMLPPPYIGPAVATEVLLRSRLKERYRLLHVDTNVHDSIDTIGTWSLRKVWLNMALYVRLARVLRTEAPDLVLVPISQSTLGFLKDSGFILLGRLFGRPTLLHLRGSDMQNWLARASWIERAFVEGVIRKAQGAVVLGERLRDLFEPYFTSDRIHVVPNGGDYRFPPRVAEPGPVRLLYVGNLQPAKGVEDVLRGAARLVERGVSDFVLDVVGSWRDAATQTACIALVASRGLPVTFHGPVYEADKLALLAQADVFVFTPREPEGHPWVIVEALAAGLPIVSTDQGAIADSVHDGINGFIVPPSDPEAIADRLERLTQEPALRARFAMASRRLYEEEFTEGRMVEKLGDAFASALGAT